MPFGPIDTTSSPYAHWRAIPSTAAPSQKGSGRSASASTARSACATATRQLERHGNFNNLRLAAGTGTGNTAGPSSWTRMSISGSKPSPMTSSPPRPRNWSRWPPPPSTSSPPRDARRLPRLVLRQVVEPDRRWADLDHGRTVLCRTPLPGRSRLLPRHRPRSPAARSPTLCRPHRHRVWPRQTTGHARPPRDRNRAGRTVPRHA